MTIDSVHRAPLGSRMLTAQVDMAAPLRTGDTSITQSPFGTGPNMWHEIVRTVLPGSGLTRARARIEAPTTRPPHAPLPCCHSSGTGQEARTEPSVVSDGSIVIDRPCSNESIYSPIQLTLRVLPEPGSSGRTLMRSRIDRFISET